MIALSLAFLVVCLFGVVAYGSSTIMAFRQASPVWTSGRGLPGHSGIPVDRVSLAMFVISTIWFVLNALSEFRRLAGGAEREGYVDVVLLAVAFIYPPLIMHVVWRESHCGSTPAGQGWVWPIRAMYVLSPAVGVALIAAIFGILPRPNPIGPFIGGALALVFTLASVYSVAVMVIAGRTAPSTDRRLDNAMVALFTFITGIFLVTTLLDQGSFAVMLIDRLSRCTPIMFLVVAVYFENRFEFFDLVIKRGVMLVVTIIALGLAFTVMRPFLRSLPAGAVGPWLAAMALVPVVMAMPWTFRHISSGLDVLWFGRAFSAVDAVKHLLGAMQSATSERSLVEETERRLAAIFAAPIAVRVDDDPSPESSTVELEASTPSGGRIRFVVLPGPGARHLLSEDLLMLRSLASVFGFMLETLRLQGKRQEQEIVARELRLQTSRSELKALRAQINPHFLFNALNAIASLIHTNPDRADEAVEQLAEVFRYTLRRSDSDWAPLDQELAFARAYLDVEQARFGQRLTCTIDSDHRSPAPQVPSMLLQTLIENAVKHGVSQTRGSGRIEVVVRTTSEEVMVEVRDNGPGPGVSHSRRQDGEGFGLRSVRERLAGHFGDRASLVLTRDDAAGETIARITMPRARVAA